MAERTKSTMASTPPGVSRSQLGNRPPSGELEWFTLRTFRPDHHQLQSDQVNQAVSETANVAYKERQGERGIKTHLSCAW
jgi:hypothetical protein